MLIHTEAVAHRQSPYTEAAHGSSYLFIRSPGMMNSARLLCCSSDLQDHDNGGASESGGFVVPKRLSTWSLLLCGTRWRSLVCRLPFCVVE